MLINLQAEGQAPLYEQIYDAIKVAILEGVFAPQERLTAIRKLSGDLNVSRNTVLMAYRRLLDEGYIYTRERSGYFVEDRANLSLLLTPGCPEEHLRPQLEVKELAEGGSEQHLDPRSFPAEQWRRLSWRITLDRRNELARQADPQGEPGLRQSIASYLYRARGVEVEPSQIVISAGTELLFSHILRLFPGDCLFGIEDPAYTRLRLILKMNAQSYVPLPLDGQGLSVEALRKENPSVVCIAPSHQFPCGIVYPISRRRELLNWANERADRFIIEDDYDSEFKYVGRPIPALKALDKEDKVIYLGSFSKALGPALRISYMVLPKSLVPAYREGLYHLLCPVPALNQLVLEAFMQEGYFARHLNRMRMIYKKKRELLVQSLKQNAIPAAILGADAGLFLVLDFGRHKVDQDFCERAGTLGLKFVPLTHFSLKPVQLYSENALLMHYADLPEDEIEERIAKFRQFCLKDFGEAE